MPKSLGWVDKGIFSHSSGSKYLKLSTEAEKKYEKAPRKDIMTSQVRCFERELSIAGKVSEFSLRRSSIVYQTFEICFTNNVWPFCHVAKHCLTMRISEQRFG